MWFSHILQEIANNHSFSFRAGMFLRTACVLSVWAITAISKRWGTPRIIFRLFLNDPPWNNAFFISLFTAVIQVSVLFSSANNSSSFLSALETAMWFSHILQEIANNHSFLFRAGMFLRAACVLSVWVITAISKRWGTLRIIFRLFLNDPPWNNAFFISLFAAVIQVSVLFSSTVYSLSFLLRTWKARDIRSPNNVDLLAFFFSSL